MAALGDGAQESAAIAELDFTVPSFAEFLRESGPPIDAPPAVS